MFKENERIESIAGCKLTLASSHSKLAVCKLYQPIMPATKGMNQPFVATYVEPIDTKLLFFTLGRVLHDGRL